MKTKVKRIFVEKKPGFDIEAKSLLKDIQENLSVKSLINIRLLNCYHIVGISDEEYIQSRDSIFSEITVDTLYEEHLVINKEHFVFAVEYLPGQYDQRADSAAECVQLLTQKFRPTILCSKIFILEGNCNKDEITKIKKYCINPVDSRETSLEKLDTLSLELNEPLQVQIIEGFINMDECQLKALISNLGLAMSLEDMKFCFDYFRVTEKRDPTITEVKVIDTYWSDHCRHTTFSTEITKIEIEKDKYTSQISKTYDDYINTRKALYSNKEKPITLMDLATIEMKELRKKGLLQDLDLSEEINACSIKADIDIDGNKEPWLIMFKNETHNHPTEIEPFGGAATCLGGAIRDPLSGRSYVYQGMRVTGSGDPTRKVEETLQGKLPQRKISTSSAQGFSSYGNQIGLATGQVTEVYHAGYIAKRMEIGAVIGAAPAKNVVREIPENGDAVILLGGRTGRDGCGGATGSSKEHTEESLLNCGAEVQKGNPPTERKIQRLFRNEKVSTLIKRCNDFGAGGVAVAIGELADGLNINLDLIHKKYEGLDGTELAISESQERMAVVIKSRDVEKFIQYANEENIEAAAVAVVNNSHRLVMSWKGINIVDLSRDFLNTNGAKSYASVLVKSPIKDENFFARRLKTNSIKENWLTTLQDLNICSQKGLSERFDSSIGSNTVLMPFGGEYQQTPMEGMVAKIPVLKGETKTATLMTFGFHPNIGKWSPFHGAVYSIVEAVTKIVCLGGDYSGVRLSLQEYFERLEKDESRWGKPFSALLGAFYAQKELEIPAIGGKDSMSGSFKDIDVPPTVVAFAVSVSEDCSKIISQEFKCANSKVLLVLAERNEEELPDFVQLKNNYSRINHLVKEGKILSANSIRSGGLCEALSKMSFGNKIGIHIDDNIKIDSMFTPDYGSIVIEVPRDMDYESELEGLKYIEVGITTKQPIINIKDEDLLIEELIEAWSNPLEDIFPTKTNFEEIVLKDNYFKAPSLVRKGSINIAKPRVFIPVFPGTNCEYDSFRAFEKAGAEVNTFVFKNLTYEQISESVDAMINEINKSQIIMLPGGFSAGDEPDGSGKFIATVFRNPRIKEAVMEFIKNKDGLILGICNGFQALIKLGLVPYGEIIDLDEECPTLTYNKIGRHVSCMINTKVVSNLSPWFNKLKLGDIHSVPVSHGEGRFVGNDKVIGKLFEKGQVATQYVDFEGRPTLNMPYNPNGSYYAIEGITSPDGRILGKMAHSERLGSSVHKNILGEKDQKIFEAGVNYFK